MDAGMAATLVPLGGLLIGLVFGATAQLSHFCTMGCVSDVVLFGSFRRARVWALALAVALAGSQALELMGWVALDRSPYRAPTLPWLGCLVGGVMFGFGMVLAGGCISRNLVRLGGGSLKALVTLLVLAATAGAMLTGVLAPLRSAVARLGTVPLAGDGGVPALLARATGLPQAPLALALTFVLASSLLNFALRDPALRRSRGDLATGILLGVLVPLGWLITAADTSPQSLNFVPPTAAALAALLRGAAPDLGLGLVAGTVLGAMAMAARHGRLRLEAFTGRDDMVRHLVGAVLMGAGGVLALGCTIGQGLTGLATLGLASLAAWLAMLAGAWWGVRYLETGSLRGVLPPWLRTDMPAG